MGCFCPPMTLPPPPTELTLSYTRGTWNAAQAGDPRLQGGGGQFLEKASGCGEHRWADLLASSNERCVLCWVTGPESRPGAPGGGLAPPSALPQVSGFSARSRFPPRGSPFFRLVQLAFSMHYHLLLSLISFMPPDRSGHPFQGVSSSVTVPFCSGPWESSGR